MSASGLIGWLRKSPQPATVLVECDGKGPQRVQIGKGGRAFAEAARTIAAMTPYNKLSCLDGVGDVLRAQVVDSEEETPAGDGRNHPDPLVVYATLLTEATKDQPILKHALAYVAQLSSDNMTLRQENEKLRAENNKLRLEIGELLLEPVVEQAEGGMVEQLLTGMAAGQRLKRVPVQPRPAAIKEGAK